MRREPSFSNERREKLSFFRVTRKKTVRAVLIMSIYSLIGELEKRLDAGETPRFKRIDSFLHTQLLRIMPMKVSRVLNGGPTALRFETEASGGTGESGDR